MKIFDRITKMFNSSKDNAEMQDTTLNHTELLPTSEDHELIPGELKVLIAEHTLGVNSHSDVPIPDQSIFTNRCRSYQTLGLVEYGQREIIIVLPLYESAVEFEQDVLKYFKMLHNFAVNNRLVEYGDFTVFEEQAPFNVPYSGIAYLKPPPNGIGPDIPDDLLLALFLHPEECPIVAAAGSYRVAGWLAHEYRIFPYPKVSDPYRSSVVPTNLPETMLGKVPMMKSLSSSQVSVTDKTLVVNIADNVLENLVTSTEVIKQSECFGIISGQVPKADSRFVWKPGSTGPEAVGHIGSKMSCIEGGFVIFVGGRDDDHALLYEDGFSVMLTPTSWSILMRSIEDKSDFELPMSGDDDRFVDQLKFRHYS